MIPKAQIFRKALLALSFSLIAVYMTMPLMVASAGTCWKCISMTGPNCVACEDGYTQTTGYRNCEPNQSTCTCEVTPGECLPNGD